MPNQKLIETLGDLAAFFALVIADADRQSAEARETKSMKRASFCSGRATAYRVSLAKLEPIIKEAKE